jgi:hypothetical protein
MKSLLRACAVLESRTSSASAVESMKTMSDRSIRTRPHSWMSPDTAERKFAASCASNRPRNDTVAVSSCIVVVISIIMS